MDTSLPEIDPNIDREVKESMDVNAQLREDLQQLEKVLSTQGGEFYEQVQQAIKDLESPESSMSPERAKELYVLLMQFQDAVKLIGPKLLERMSK